MAILIFLALLLSLITTYLLYVRFSKKKLTSIRKKHPAGSKNYELYRVIYSPRTLILSAFFSLMAITNILIHILRTLAPQNSTLVASIMLVLMILPIALLFYWLRNDKSNK